MKVIDKLTLVDRIGRELQSTMGYKDIDAYLSALGVDINKETSGVNSKWVYTKELLADAPEDLVLKIANELNISHDYGVAESLEAIEATFWEPQHFKLFLSHLSSYKEKVGALQVALKEYGISAFVAHVDIEPTREWQNEIEAGLFTMDALAAILMPGFKESSWTDQEVGVAVGRGVLIIPVIHGLTPYGFIGKYQGLKSKGRMVQEVANDIFTTLVNSSKSRSRMLTCIVDTTLQSPDTFHALRKIKILDQIKDIPAMYLERLRDGADTSAVFKSGAARKYLDKMLTERGINRVDNEPSLGVSIEDIPF